jgi:hypothetical protein
MSATFAMLGIGMVVWGPVTDAIGARWVFGGAAFFAFAGAVVGRELTRGVSAAAAAEPVSASG